MTHYLLDFAPDGTQEVLVYTQSEMEDTFAPEELAALAKGERVVHHWHPRRARNHAIVDMVVTTNQKWGK